MKRPYDVLVDLALRTFPDNAELVLAGGPSVPTPRLAARRVNVVREDEALALLQARAHAPVDGVLALMPTGFAPLMPFLSAARAALRPNGRALVLDLAWQTAPPLELLRAFAPAAGREKVRPVEGYEMQMEHAGFTIDERVDVEREAWAATLAPEQRRALEADERGAARVLAWVLSPTSDDD